jgi:hypothetical protein
MDNWADLEGGRGVGKEGVLKKWGESVGIKVLDLAERESRRLAPHWVELTVMYSQSRPLESLTPLLTSLLAASRSPVSATPLE